MSAETTQPTGRDQAGGMDLRENKYIQVLELAWARKRQRANLEDDYRRAHYEPAVPPSPSAD